MYCSMSLLSATDDVHCYDLHIEVLYMRHATGVLLFKLVVAEVGTGQDASLTVVLRCCSHNT